MEILANTYSDKTERGRAALANHINGTNPLEVFDGELDVIDGVIQNTVSIINARSLAEDVVVMRDAKPFNGSINITEGRPEDLTLEFKGRSLVHSAPLTAEAFTRSYFGHYGQYIVSIGLLLFAFSTAISWSYYGGRAMTYLLGSKSVKYYRIVYVIAFFIASFADTTVIWTLSGITIALMTLPNLFGILMLRKDMKSTVADYWVKFKKDFPEESTPE
jgi:AGCS family alanine or glycine:cation symporter